ncbi:MAG: FGGY-family carbohydrate kinase, partial [Acidimicrobiales bacterium]
MTDLVLGIDVGTTSAKAVLIARDGTLHGRGSSDPIPTRSPEPGGSEQDPYELRQAVAVACRRALGDTDTRPRVLAVAAGAQSGSLVAIGSDDEPVGPVITWLDTRSRPLLDSWPSEVRERVRAVSGWSALPGLGLASICWLRQCRPEQFGDACRFASADDLVTRWLTGRWVSNPSNASGLQLMDVGELRWSDELCELAGISPRQLSALQPTGSVHG